MRKTLYVLIASGTNVGGYPVYATASIFNTLGEADLGLVSRSKMDELWIRRLCLHQVSHRALKNRSAELNQILKVLGYTSWNGCPYQQGEISGFGFLEDRPGQNNAALGK